MLGVEPLARSPIGRIPSGPEVQPAQVQRGLFDLFKRVPVEVGNRGGELEVRVVLLLLSEDVYGQVDECGGSE